MSIVTFITWEKAEIRTDLNIQKRWYRWFKEHALMSDGNVYVRITAKGKDGKAIWRKK